MEYALGLIFGLAAGIGIVALLIKKKVMDMTFDERQERARGKAFQYGFFTLIGCLILYGFTDVLLGKWCDTLTGCVICVCIGLMVFAVTCILNDAYLSLKEKPRTFVTAFLLVAVSNFLIGGVNLLQGDVIVDGVLTVRSVNFICALMMLVVLAVYIVNHLLSGREEAE